MNIQESRSELLFTSSTGDWLFRVTINEDDSLRFLLELNVQGPTLSSGINFEHIGPFVEQVKAEVLARGLNWSGESHG